MPFPQRTITYENRSLTLGEWSRLKKIPVATLRSRLDKQGWTVARALSTPVDRRFSAVIKRVPVNVPRPVPTLKHHRGRGLAYSTWHAQGKQWYRYFGPWGSDEAAEGYRRFVSEWLASGAKSPSPGDRSRTGAPLVANLVGEFMGWARVNYVKNGRRTSSYHAFSVALMRLLRSYGRTPAASFGADQLRAFISGVIRDGKSLRTVNYYQWCVVFAFGWGVTHGSLVPASVASVLERVEYQRPGRTAARETRRKLAVPVEDVEAVIPYLHADATARGVFESLIRVQLLTGARSGELCGMRAGDIEKVGDLWRYRPAGHKNAHRGHDRVIWFGPRAQAIVSILVAGVDSTAFVFGYQRARSGRRLPITVNLYRQRVAMACKRAGVRGWHPHQLRHNRATELHQRYESDEAVRVGIGDTPEVARQVYVDDPAGAVARRIARETG